MSPSMSDMTPEPDDAAEARLAAYWRLTEAPARDLEFELGLEALVARRRMLLDVANRTVAALAVCAAVVLAGPIALATLAALASSFDAAGPALAGVAVLGGVMLWMNRRADESLDEG